MITSLLFAALGQATSRSPMGGFVSYGSGPPVGYSSPVFLSVASGAVHTITAKATDSDIYKLATVPYDLHTLAYSSEIDINGSFGSGNILGVEGWWRTESIYDYKFLVWTVKAPVVGSDETLITYDYFIARDTISGNRHDVDSPRFTTVVQINGSDPRDGSGRSR